MFDELRERIAARLATEFVRDSVTISERPRLARDGQTPQHKTGGFDAEVPDP